MLNTRKCKLLTLLTLLISLIILGLTSFYTNQCTYDNINSSVKLCIKSRTITPTRYYDHYLVIPNTNNITSNIYYYFAYLSDNNNIIKTICDQETNTPNYIISNYSIYKYNIGYQTKLFINVDTNVCNINVSNSYDWIGTLVLYLLVFSSAISFFNIYMLVACCLSK